MLEYPTLTVTAPFLCHTLQHCGLSVILAPEGSLIEVM